MNFKYLSLLGLPVGEKDANLERPLITQKDEVSHITSNFSKETTKKRKRDEEEESTSQNQRPLLQEPAKKVKVKKLSDADKKLASRLVRLSLS